MSIDTSMVCCNCRHCIRNHDDKHHMTICRCEKYNIYLSYVEVMSGSCVRWEERREE